MANRADQIRDRIEAIDAKLAAEPPRPGPGDQLTIAFLFDSMPEEERLKLIEEKRALQREYDRLPPHLKDADVA